jgi:hypothetical protein
MVVFTILVLMPPRLTCDDEAPEAAPEPPALLLHEGDPVEIVDKMAARVRHHQRLTVRSCSNPGQGGQRSPTA